MKNSRPNRRSLSKGDTSNRDRILKAATDLFREKGYAGLSISSICDRVGIAPTSLYWHFGDKSGLLQAVIQEISAGYADQLQGSVLDASGDPSKQLDLIVSGIRSLVTTQPSGALSFVAMLAQGATEDEELGRAMADARRRELDMITGSFAAALGQDKGRTTALLVLASVNYAALVFRVTKDEEDVDEILRAMRVAIEMQMGIPDS